MAYGFKAAASEYLNALKKSIKEVSLKLLWRAWKELQVLYRSRLSLALASVLVVLVVIRERKELLSILWGLLSFTHWPGLFDILILVLTGLTIGAAIWEIRGDKLSTSPQEVRFAIAIHELLILLEKYGYAPDQDNVTLEARLEKFIRDFLEITRNTLCGKKHIDSGLMTYESKRLTLKMSSQGSRYPEPDSLIVPVPPADRYFESGPAAIAIDKLKITYMPFKGWKRAWLFSPVSDTNESGDGQDFQASDLDVGWVDASNPELENFRSILCLPVSLYISEAKKDPKAVINYSTSHFDPFVDRDFIMGECFASILAHAFAIAKEKASKQTAKVE